MSFLRILVGCRVAILTLAIGACNDAPTAMSLGDTHARLYFQSSLPNAFVESIVITVTASDIPEPLVFNIPIEDGAATGSITIPAGSDRLIVVRAYDFNGVETHRGSTSVTIREGTNSPIELRLVPLIGTVEVAVTFASYQIEIAPTSAELVIGDTLILAATVRDPNGLEIGARVHWGTFDSEIATVDTAGVVNAMAAGETRVVAVFGGAATEMRVAVVTLSERTENLLGGAFRHWYIANGAYAGPSMALAAAALEYSSSAANSGAVEYSAIPRAAIANYESAPYYQNLEWVYLHSYTALENVAIALSNIENDSSLVNEFRHITPASVTAAEAFGRFVQGLALGTVALLYDQGVVIDETTIGHEPAPAPYTALLEQALEYFEEAIELAEGHDFTVARQWMTRPVSSSELVRIASSLKARYRAAVARTPQERADVDWQAVLQDIDAGLDTDFLIDLEYVYGNWLGGISHLYTSQPGTWAFTTYWIEGMADQSGKYQEWLSIPLDNRHPELPTGPFLIQTPDERFPQGETLEEQIANPGVHYKIFDQNVNQWGRPDRGMWRWSYYDDTNTRKHTRWLFQEHPESESFPEYAHSQMRLLAAEAYYRLGQPALAASIINETRTLYGLRPTDAAGTNQDCVPRLPSGACGTLFEMLKWEKRLEGKMLGLMQAPGYFDSRGWGDLLEGTPLQFPVPLGYLHEFGLAPYTFGGVGGESASTGSTYGWLSESNGP